MVVRVLDLHRLLELRTRKRYGREHKRQDACGRDEQELLSHVLLLKTVGVDAPGARWRGTPKGGYLPHSMGRATRRATRGCGASRNLLNGRRRARPRRGGSSC